MSTLVVTGGSRGIGAAVCRSAARAGWDIVLAYRERSDAAAEVVAGIEAGGGSALAVRADVAEAADVESLFAAAARWRGPVTGLVNNAGISGGFARVDEVSAATLREVLDVNVAGPFLCAGAAVRAMSTLHGGAGGAIVNVSSRAAVLGSPGEWVHYAASKAALDALTVGLAREVATEGVRVNAVAVGLVDTDFHAAAGEPGRPERIRPTVPMRRSGTPEEVASAVCWLLSDDASYTTGTVLAVSGGR
jgi:NAD(P)-dependent dehydrogenase (short-subunit alcohol dehydrogenase family)